MTTMNLSIPFPDPSDQSPKSRAKRKWAPPTLTIEAVGNTAVKLPAASENGAHPASGTLS
jgi:hypothetical protein